MTSSRRVCVRRSELSRVRRSTPIRNRIVVRFSSSKRPRRVWTFAKSYSPELNKSRASEIPPLLPARLRGGISLLSRRLKAETEESVVDVLFPRYIRTLERAAFAFPFLQLEDDIIFPKESIIRVNDARVYTDTHANGGTNFGITRLKRQHQPLLEERETSPKRRALLMTLRARARVPPEIPRERSRISVRVYRRHGRATEETIREDRSTVGSRVHGRVAERRSCPRSRRRGRRCSRRRGDGEERALHVRTRVRKRE